MKPPYFRWILFFLLSAFLVWKGWELSMGPPSITSFLNLNFRTQGGEEVRLDSIPSDFRLVSLVQSWCGDCIREAPSIGKLQSGLGKDSRLKVVFVSDEPWEKIQDFRTRIEKKGSSLSEGGVLFLQSPDDFGNLGVRFFPTTYLLNREGKVLLVKQEGFDWNSESVRSLLESDSFRN